jgi:hypothetical protein
MGPGTETLEGNIVSENVMVLADLQIPYHDVKALDAVYDYMEDLGPDLTIFLGDILDFPYLTTKFLRTHADPTQLVSDIAMATHYIDRARRLSDRVVFVEGNHEARLRNFILERANALEGLVAPGQALDLATMLGLNTIGGLTPLVDYYGPYGSAYLHRSFVFKHGDYANRYAAMRELAMEGSSGMSGHTHSFQQFAKTDRSGAHAWWSVGCLCYTTSPNMPPGVHEGQNRLRDWQQGFAVMRFADGPATLHSGLFAVHPVIIVDGRFISPEGKVYG